MARNCNGANYFQVTSGLPSLTSLTLSIWFNMGSLANSYTGLIGRSDGNTNLYNIFVKSTGHLAYYLDKAGGGATQVDPGSGSVSTGSWHHAALVYDNASGNLKTYLDGASDGTASATNAIGNAGNFFLGNDAFANRILTGSIADGAFWSATLTAGEIGALAKGARPRDIRTGSLSGWWPLDGLASPEPDLSGAALNASAGGTGTPSLSAGPPVMMFTPRWPQFIPSAATSSAVFRKTLSQIGGRIGSRQASVGWFN